MHEAIRSHLSDAGPLGDFARSVQRDPCWPDDPRASCWQMELHIRDAHGDRADLQDRLQAIFEPWMFAWDAYGGHPAVPGWCDGDHGWFPPRQPILEAAAETGLRVNSNGMAFCWNDDTSAPTCGHWGGNKEPSLKLYTHNDTFFCHQCGIWGFSDQLKARTWQGIRR